MLCSDPQIMALLKYFKHIEPSKEERIQSILPTVQLSYKIMSAHVSLASFLRVTCDYHACRSQVSCVPLASITCVTRV